ncbi:MAG TPA: helix-turn-helix domain-containing protein [Blastocatellia bacterium]|nr:helix-turn-helix domain-containing protein [Blastocatellia bacterium]
MTESLSQYVQRIINDKGLTQREIERRSGDKITGSHISKVISGKAGNLTADKILGLAIGLGVNPVEIFVRLIGEQPSVESELDARTLLNLMQKVVDNPMLLEILSLAERLTPTGQEVLINSLRLMNQRSEPQQRPKPRKRRIRRS